MEGPSEVAVSLDELTLDIAFDVPEEPDQNAGIVELGGGDNTEDADVLNSQPFYDLSRETRETQDSPNDKMIVAEGGFNSDLINKDQIENPSEVLNEIVSKYVDVQMEAYPTENAETASDVDDFEADVHPLTLFPKKTDDDEDFEFEFPEPNDSIPGPSLNTNKKTVNFIETAKEIVQEDTTTTRLDTSRQDNLEPEILTPRLEETPDLKNILQEVKKQTDELINEEDIELGRGKDFSVPEEPKDEKIQELENDTDDEGERNRPSIVTTAEDWDQVQVVVPGFADHNKSKSGETPVVESKPLAKFSDTWSEMAAMNYDDVKGQIKTKTDRRGISAFTHFLFGPPKLHKDLIPERDIVFCVAATKFDNNNEIHSRMLQTIYRYLTGSKFDCQRFGSHWEEIGFQGQDPATDLRGGGVLSLLHILYFLQEPHTKDLARNIYKLSLHPTQNFPFCVMSINITVMCLRVMREDLYNKECNRRKDVVGTMTSLYVTLFLHLYQLWKKGKTIHDSGYVLEEVASYCRKNSKNIFKDLELYEKNRKEQLFGDHPSDNPSFFNVCKQDKCDDKSAAELY